MKDNNITTRISSMERDKQKHDAALQIATAPIEDAFAENEKPELVKFQRRENPQS